MIQSIKGVFFDAGWVLFHPANPDWFINKKVTEYVDVSLFEAVPFNKKTAAFNHAISYLNNHHFIATEQEEFEQFKEFYSMIADSLPEFMLTKEKIDAIAYSKVYDMDNYIFYNDAKPTLEAL